MARQADYPPPPHGLGWHHAGFSQDGPSEALLRFMEKPYQFKAAASWKCVAFSLASGLDGLWALRSLLDIIYPDSSPSPPATPAIASTTNI